MKTLHKLLFLFIAIVPLATSAHKGDSLYRPLNPVHYNVIKFNPTPMLLWSKKNVTISYERVLNPKQ